MVREGETFDDILLTMAQGHWDEVEARSLIRRMVSKERRGALLLMIGGAFVALASFLILRGIPAGAMLGGYICDILYVGIIGGAIGFVWGLARLVKIRA